MNITHDMSNDLTEYDPESRQVDGPNPIENRISSSAARVPDIISCTSGITVQGRQLHSFAFTTDAAIIRNTNADAILAVYPFTGEPVITQALLTAAQAPLFVGVGGGAFAFSMDMGLNLLLSAAGYRRSCFRTADVNNLQFR